MYDCDVVVKKKLTFAILSPDEFLVLLSLSFNLLKMTRAVESRIHYYTDEDNEARLGTDNSPS